MILKKRQKNDERQLGTVKYEWAWELLDQAQANSWFPAEIPLSEDLTDWKKMNDEERRAVVTYIGFSNPMEYEVNESIINGMMPFISAPEVNMYLVRQMWEEVNHSLTFNYIINTLDIDRTKAFGIHTDIPEVSKKEAFLVSSIEKMTEGNIDVETDEGIRDFVRNIVRTNIVTEGIWFYSGFMFALSFRQRGLMKRLGSLTDWIARDEALHLKVGINLILTILEENPRIVTPEFAEEIKSIVLEAVELEIAYNKALIPNGILGMNADYITQYVKYVADRRLEELGFGSHFKVSNPAKWMTTANDTFQLVNFFEAQNTAYEVNGAGSAGLMKSSN